MDLLDPLPDPVRRLCVAVEGDGASRGDPRPPLVEVVERAGMAAGLDQATLQIQPTGVLLVLTSGVNEARVVAGLTRELGNTLWRRNRRSPGGHRLRCRLSFHQGLVRLTDDGFTGQAVSAVAEMCASADLRAELAGSPSSDLAMIISGQLLDDLAYPESPDLHKTQFRPVVVTTPTRSISAYVYALGPPA
ncbi:hypothetical protein ABGB17_04310 [Sphaerisporangium sp. B11E5]|uniref:hypothetical protein n=1 Tax=Sphaerisporangium sp. B11E5 TaxID=3153563 RepID=UPI00325F75C0